MSYIATLKMTEQSVVDQDELARIFVRMDPAEAEETFMGLIKSLTDHLAMAEKHLRAQNLSELADTMALVELISGRLCMPLLSQVAEDVMECCDRGDLVALGSTHARLLRVGEGALREIWDLKRSYI